MVPSVLKQEIDPDQAVRDAARPCPHARMIRTWDPDGVDPVVMCLDCKKWELSLSLTGLSFPDEEEDS